MKDRIKLDNGKYEVISYDDGILECLRGGRRWRDLTGDNLILHMFYRIKIMEDGWNELKDKIDSDLAKEYDEFFKED